MIWSKAPGLKPIENLWADMKFWLIMTPAKCSNYIDHLQEVLLAVIARDGG